MSSDDHRERGVAANDLDDVIELATKEAEAQRDQVSMDEMKAIGGELGLSPEEIEAGAAELRRKRQAELNAAHADHLRRRRFLHVGVAVAGVLLLYAGYTGWRMADRMNMVEQQRSQVVNVVERQRAVEGRLEGRPADRNADAERAGSENRVRIERKRYDEVAAAYNRVAGGLMGRLVGAVTGQPARVPLSSEVQW